MHILEPEVRQGLGHHGNTSAVQRGVNNAEVFSFRHRLRIQGEPFDQGEIDVVDVLADDADQVGATVPFHLIYGLDFVDLSDDVFVVRRHELAAIVPIDLVTVIFFRVV